MQLKTFLILFCTTAIFFVELNDGATTKNTTAKNVTPIEKQKNITQEKQILLGGHTPWDTKIKAKHKKIFDDYKNITSKKLQQVHKVPKSFVPKPDKFSTQVVGGINYLYLVKLPTNKYAFVSIHHVAWKKNHYGKEENVQVRSQTYALNDKTV